MPPNENRAARDDNAALALLTPYTRYHWGRYAARFEAWRSDPGAAALSPTDQVLGFLATLPRPTRDPRHRTPGVPRPLAGHKRG